MWLPWSAADGQLICTPWEYALEPCLINGVGLLPWEWERFKQQERNSQPGAEVFEQHSLHAVHAAEASDRPGTYEGFNVTEHIVAINSIQALEEGGVLQHQPLVLLNSLVHVTAADQQQELAFDVLQHQCRMLNTSLILTRYSEEHWGLLHGKPVDSHDLHTAMRLRAGKLHRRDQLVLVQHQQG